ncbi:MAG: hypothetical protein M1824_001175 [Vezdaea acicularis]|nr:MAG: hypothetical protein M1824_001175 [Vezdaea acicularis]
MAFEVKELHLSDLSEEVLTAIYKSFNGGYRFPPENYTRFWQCADLEIGGDRADELTNAFSKLTKVQDIGLSMSSGLGWLSGPDVTDQKQRDVADFPVFRRRLNSLKSGSQNLATHTSHTATETLGSMHKVIHTKHPNFDARDKLQMIQNVWVTRDAEFEVRFAREYLGPWDPAPLGSSGGMGGRGPLIPVKLTTIQKQWLLMTSWAQRGFLSLWMRSIMNNSFAHVHTLNLARLPSGLVEDFGRRDFWTCFPNLTRLSLNVSPDWRASSAYPAPVVCINNVGPSESVELIFTLLQEFISPLKSLKTLEFGWIGGGERAQGLFTRNAQLLSAPIMAGAEEFLKPTDRASKALMLPWVQHLTLSNCWATPKALMDFVTDHKKSLRTLTLDSFSITVQPMKAVWILPRATHNLQQNVIERPLTNFPPASEPRFMEPAYAWMGPCRPGSWIDVIEGITPGPTLAEKRFAQGLQSKLPKRNTDAPLEEIKLVSCGYAILPTLNWDQCSLNPSHRIPHGIRAINERRDRLRPMMMNPNQPYLDKILQFMPDAEMFTLATAWGAIAGWEDVPGVDAWDSSAGWVDPARARHVCDEGFFPGGTGRFRVTLRRASESEGSGV